MPVLKAKIERWTVKHKLNLISSHVMPCDMLEVLCIPIELQQSLSPLQYRLNAYRLRAVYGDPEV